jgi:hypothetical protein
MIFYDINSEKKAISCCLLREIHIKSSFDLIKLLYPIQSCDHHLSFLKLYPYNDLTLEEFRDEKKLMNMKMRTKPVSLSSVSNALSRELLSGGSDSSVF